jgi:hypothetical protein
VNLTNESLSFESCFTVSLSKKNISQYPFCKILFDSFVSVASHKAQEFSNETRYNSMVDTLFHIIIVIIILNISQFLYVLYEIREGTSH